jgi:hypothetical protein
MDENTALNSVSSVEKIHIKHNILGSMPQIKSFKYNIPGSM